MANSGDELEADQATARKHFKIMQFVMECGLKLHLRSVTLATASILYHKFFQNCSLDEYDPYLIATAAIYLAGKVEEQHLKVRDVVNVCYRNAKTPDP
ncbi:cyclin-Q-like [Lingula anatina]|uniref:Cyclin-Q-like n=1 Tax=Lingula anatina TaxID=7574 RepID=A0A1S3HJ96_LINAN|nr:cyclin-Q-like [Lingula anatina]|eukprot:XP_013385064.1 cyclin-Q-like [Lingula anatina]